MPHFVYILANRPYGPIYIGECRDLRSRVEQHRLGAVKSHTAKYKIKTLVWFEQHSSIIEARIREMRLKRWRRAWKDQLIDEINPQWKDITSQIPL